MPTKSADASASCTWRLGRSSHDGSARSARPPSPAAVSRFATTLRTKDEFTDREVSPQRIVFYRGNWYLDAWCHLRQDLRSFAIDAMQSVSLTDKPAREVETEALDVHLGAGYGIFSGAADQHAVLRFNPESARYVGAERWHARQTETLGVERAPDPDGSLLEPARAGDGHSPARSRRRGPCSYIIEKPGETPA